MRHLNSLRILAIGVSLAVVALSSHAAEPAKVTVAVIGITASNWPGVVAQEKGFFKEEGLDVQWFTAGQSSKAAQQVMAGAANIGSSSMVDTFRAIDAGGDLVIFMNSLAQGVHQLVASKDVKSVAELKGRRVMVGGQKDITALWWNAMAKNYSLNPSQDVQLLFSGSTSNRLTALVSGAVDAAVLSPPASFQAVEQGLTDLGPVARYLGEFPMMIYHVNKTWADKNRDKVVAFVKAHNRAAVYMLDPKNKQEVSEILAKASNTTVADALRTYDVSLQVQGFVPDGAISEATVERVKTTLAADGDLKTPLKPASAFFDPQYVQAAK